LECLWSLMGSQAAQSRVRHVCVVQTGWGGAARVGVADDASHMLRVKPSVWFCARRFSRCWPLLVPASGVLLRRVPACFGCMPQNSHIPFPAAPFA
jgi:hypothetical protein